MTMHSLSILPFLLSGALSSPAPTGYSGVQPVLATPARLDSVKGGSVSCRTEYTTVWDTKYVETETEVCTTEYEKVCRTEFEKLCQPTTREVCEVKYDTQCATVYKNVCVEQYKTEYEPYTETECVTEYKDDCEYRWEGQGNAKEWVVIPGTCKTNPYNNCRDVQRQKERQVAYPVCEDVPEQQCAQVPREECYQVKDQICQNQPLQKCEQVPRQVCQQIHKKVPQRISRQHPKKVCDTQQGYPAVPVAAVPVSAIPATLPEIIAAKNGEPQITVRSNNEKLLFSS